MSTPNLKTTDPLDQEIAELEKKLGIADDKNGFINSLKHDNLFELYDIFPEESENGINEPIEQSQYEEVDLETIISRFDVYLHKKSDIESAVGFLFNNDDQSIKDCLKEVSVTLLNGQNTEHSLLLLLKLIIFLNPKFKVLLIKQIALFSQQSKNINIKALGSLYVLNLLSDTFIKDLFVKIMEREDSVSFDTLFKLTGYELRQRSPQSLADLMVLLTEKGFSGEFGKQFKRLKNNMVERDGNVDELIKSDKSLKNDLSEVVELKSQIKLEFSIEKLKSLNLRNKQWWKEIVIQKNVKRVYHTDKASLQTKYQKTLEKLTISNEKQTDILFIILEAENFKKASENLSEYLKVEKNYNDVFFVILELIFYEDKVNKFYVYLTRNLLRSNKIMLLKFKRFVWIFYLKKIDAQSELNRISLFIDYVQEIMGLGFFGFKLLEGFDFFTNKTPIHLFNNLFIQKLIIRFDEKYLKEELDKCSKIKKRYKTIEELRDFLDEFMDNEFSKKFQDCSDKEKQLYFDRIECIRRFNRHFN